MATDWRELSDQLTPEQVTRFEHFEVLALAAHHTHETPEDIAAGLLAEARQEATHNLSDAMFDVAVPAGTQAEHWEDDGTGCFTRRLSLSSRSVKRPGADSAVCVDGVQHTDGTVAWSLYVLADDRKPFTGVQARSFAAMILQAADIGALVAAAA